jgi:hypothetical protein
MLLYLFRCNQKSTTELRKLRHRCGLRVGCRWTGRSSTSLHGNETRIASTKLLESAIILFFAALVSSNVLFNASRTICLA